MRYMFPISSSILRRHLVFTRTTSLWSPFPLVGTESGWHRPRLRFSVKHSRNEHLIQQPGLTLSQPVSQRFHGGDYVMYSKIPWERSSAIRIPALWYALCAITNGPNCKRVRKTGRQIVQVKQARGVTKLIQDLVCTI